MWDGIIWAVTYFISGTTLLCLRLLIANTLNITSTAWFGVVSLICKYDLTTWPFSLPHLARTDYRASWPLDTFTSSCDLQLYLCVLMLGTLAQKELSWNPVNDLTRHRNDKDLLRWCWCCLLFNVVRTTGLRPLIELSGSQFHFGVLLWKTGAQKSWKPCFPNAAYVSPGLWPFGT